MKNEYLEVERVNAQCSETQHFRKRKNLRQKKKKLAINNTKQSKNLDENEKK